MWAVSFVAGIGELVARRRYASEFRASAGRADRGGRGEGDVSDPEDVRKVVETAR
jgi:hypothetical protein